MATTHAIVCASCGDHRDLIVVGDVWTCINQQMCDRRREMRARQTLSRKSARFAARRTTKSGVGEEQPDAARS